MQHSEAKIRSPYSWKQRVRNLLIPAEPAIPAALLGEHAERFARLAAGDSVCIKLSCAYDLPYPFSASVALVTQVVAEIYAANPDVRIVLTEGGVGAMPIRDVAEKQGLTAIPHARFLDAEESEAVFVPNPNPTPYQADGFWLPTHWMEATERILLTTCKLRSHHFQRWYSGGCRNLIGLLPRAHYRLQQSRRNMRSALHQQGMDAMAADLYATAGQNLLTILDARLLARQDEHLPLRFTRRIGQVLVDTDPYRADERMADLLRLPFTPPYLAMIAAAGHHEENIPALADFIKA